MVHSSLGKVGYTVGGPVVVIRALLQVLTPQGTLVLGVGFNRCTSLHYANRWYPGAAQRSAISDHAGWQARVG
jgi:aminoglycoside N3'-acetyltransferase